VRKFIPARFVPGSAIDADGKRRIEFWLRMVFSALIDAWTNYFRYAACKRTLSRLVHFVWSRVIRWFRALHHWTWKDVRRRFTTPDRRWKPIEADGITRFNRACNPRFLRPRRRVRNSSPYRH
jgi:hypothetical protein